MLTSERITTASNYGPAVVYLIAAFERVCKCYTYKKHSEDLEYIIKHSRFLINMLSEIKKFKIKLYKESNEPFNAALLNKAKNSTNIDDPKLIELNAALITLFVHLLLP